MSLRTLITRKLEAGTYQPNHFLIVLDPATPFVSGPDDDPILDPRYLHVFIHEYWHYWHNISTVSGFKSFAFTQHLLALFSGTLLKNHDGTSEGMTSLSDSERTSVATLLTLARDLDGDDAPIPNWAADFDLSFTVTAIHEEDDSYPYRQANAPNPRAFLDVEARWPDGRTASGTMALGSVAIEESVAFLVEEQVRKSISDAALGEAPAFPYRVVDAVYEHVVGAPAPAAYYLAALGTLALLATHPGPALVAFCRVFARELEKGAPEHALRVVVSGFREALQRSIGTALTDLSELEAMQHDRGLLEGAVAHFARACRAALDRRGTNPLFDLDAIFPAASQQRLRLHTDAFPSCDLLQQHKGDADGVMRDALYSFDPTLEDEYGLRPTDYTRSFQAQQDFLYAHADRSAGELVESARAESCCPYFAACPLEYRAKHPEVCGKTPWRAFVSAGEGCWYSTAVAATLGRVQIKKKSKS